MRTVLIIIGILIFGAVGGWLIGDYQHAPQTEIGSVAMFNEYRATSTSGWSGHKVLGSNTTSVLGSIVIASSSDAEIVIWNATSTTDMSSSTLTTIKANPTAGDNYVFDAVLGRGLIIETGTGNVGDYVITYRTY